MGRQTRSSDTPERGLAFPRTPKAYRPLMTADRFSEEVVEASRARLGLPDDYEWYSCAAECGDIVWCPPGMGDRPVAPVCSPKCLAKYVAAVERAHGS